MKRQKQRKILTKKQILLPTKKTDKDAKNTKESLGTESNGKTSTQNENVKTKEKRDDRKNE